MFIIIVFLFVRVHVYFACKSAILLTFYVRVSAAIPAAYTVCLDLLNDSIKVVMSTKYFW